jgi:hypothetical protein
MNPFKRPMNFAIAVVLCVLPFIFLTRKDTGLANRAYIVLEAIWTAARLLY